MSESHGGQRVYAVTRRSQCDKLTTMMNCGSSGGCEICHIGENGELFEVLNNMKLMHFVNKNAVNFTSED